MRISDWSSDVCSSDLGDFRGDVEQRGADQRRGLDVRHLPVLGQQMDDARGLGDIVEDRLHHRAVARPGPLRLAGRARGEEDGREVVAGQRRSEEHTSELQSLMRISYAVFCLKKKT